jgi:hypothetical protein
MGTTTAEQMKHLFGSFEFLNKAIAFVKDKGVNLGMMTTTLKNIVSCGMLDLPTPCAETCLGHAMLKIAQYATNDNKVYGGLLRKLA